MNRGWSATIPIWIKKPGRPFAGDAGFTLIEVLVTIAVGGIVLLAGITTLSAVQDRSEHAVEATMGVREAAAVRAALVDWLTTAEISIQELGAGFEGHDAEQEDLSSDELSFPTRSRTALRTSPTAVRLYMDSDPETPERGLVAELRGRISDQPVRMELVPEAADLQIRYLPTGDASVEWVESWIGISRLPAAVELTLLEDPDAPLPPLLRLPIRVAMTRP